LNLLPIGSVGEIYIGGIGLARGYWNRPELTSERFIANPFGNGDRLYKTGDLGRFLPDGNIEYLGRIDNQVKIRGFRIELGEIESVIGGLSEISAVTVLAKSVNDNMKELVAYVVPKEIEGYERFGEIESQTGEKISIYNGKEVVDLIGVMREAIEKKLPEYMMPSHFVILEKMPLTPNGKTDGKLLVKLSTEDCISEAEYIGPRNEIEEKLCKIWQEVLHLKRVGIKDNFFKIGGDSIIAMQVVSRLRYEGMILQINDIFSEKCIDSLSKKVIFSDQEQGKHCDFEKNFDGNHFYKLMPIQKGLLFNFKKFPKSKAYIVQNLYCVENLNESTLKQATKSLIKNSPILSSYVTFHNDDYYMNQASEIKDIPIYFHEGGDFVNKEDIVEKFLVIDREEGIDLEKFPLFRFNIFRFNNGISVIIFTFHHVLLDGWSAANIFSRLLKYYDTISECKEVLDSSDFWYKDYVQWFYNQEQFTTREYWRNYLRGLNDVPLLCGGAQSDLGLESLSFSEINRKVSGDRFFKFKQFLYKNELTASGVILGVIGIVLQKYLNADDVLVGCVISNRTAPFNEMSSMDGLFINTLPIRIKHNSLRLLEYLKKIQSDVQNAINNSSLSLTDIMKNSDVAIKSFDVVFSFENYPTDGYKSSQLTVLSKNSFEHTEYPLTVVSLIQDNELVIKYKYEKNLLTHSMIESISSSIINCLNEILDSYQDDMVDNLLCLTEREKKRQLDYWNSNSVEVDNTCLHENFENIVRKKGDSIALIFDGNVMTYSDLNEKSNQLAHYLQKQIQESYEFIAICLDKSFEMFTSILSVLKVGLAYIPIDPDYPQSRISYIINDSKVKIVITQSKYNNLFKDILVINVDDNKSIKNESKSNLNKKVNVTDLAYVIYTSGTTGNPKGVMICHLGVINLINHITNSYGIEETDKVLSFATFCFDASVLEMFTALLNGAKLCIFDNRKNIECINDVDANVALFPPTLLKNLDLSSYRLIFAGGEALSSEVSRYGCENVRQFINAYGPTECTVSALMNDVKKGETTIGVPISNTTAYILDKRLQLLPVGSIGEIYLGGIGLARGYLNKPDLTSEKFIANPFGKGDRLYKTGDLGRFLLDGSIEYLGRIDDQVKLRGFRIELNEIIENINRISTVNASVVLLKKDNENKKYLVAYVVPKNNEKLKIVGNFNSPSVNNLKIFGGDMADAMAQKIKESLLEKIPNYMIPSYFVFIDKIPLTLNKKVDRKTLLNLNVKDAKSVRYEAPKTDIEKKLCKIWQDIFGISQVGINEDFFTLGGDSIIAMQIVAKAKSLGLIFSIKDILSHSTIALLSPLVSISAQNDDTVSYNFDEDEMFDFNMVDEIQKIESLL